MLEASAGASGVDTRAITYANLIVRDGSEKQVLHAESLKLPTQAARKEIAGILRTTHNSLNHAHARPRIVEGVVVRDVSLAYTSVLTALVWHVVVSEAAPLHLGAAPLHLMTNGPRARAPGH